MAIYVKIVSYTNYNYLRAHIFKTYIIISANNQSNTEEHIDGLPKGMDCDKVSCMK